MQDPNQALALWCGLHLLLTLLLALNVTRHRLGQASGSITLEQLEKSVRAHGNNIEYVPFALMGFVIMALTGVSALWIHSLAGALFVARLCHAHGITRLGEGLPKTRVIGNIGTWLVFLTSAILLIVHAL